MIHGIINVYKEKGYTSHDVVAKLRGIAGQRKIGHTGTLDPDAEGVLPVCLGRATKLCDMLTDKDKTYEAVMLLGVTTDTQDTTGKVLSEKEVAGITEKQAEEAILGFVGEYSQIPPMYSALKVNGKKLYELAREGIEVERKARKVTIHEIEIVDIALPRVRMRVHCSKGTYIRTLCHDIGEKLGCGACMESLLRTKVSRFELKDSVKLSEIQERKADGSLYEIIVPVDAMFSEYRSVTVTEEKAALAYNGNEIPLTGIKGKDRSFEEQEQVRLYDESCRFIGIYQYQKNGRRFKIVKMFFERGEETTCSM